MSLKDQREKIVTKKVAVVTEDVWEEEEKQIDDQTETDEIATSDQVGDGGTDASGEDREDSERLEVEEKNDPGEDWIINELERVDNELKVLYNKKIYKDTDEYRTMRTLEKHRAKLRKQLRG